MRISSKAGALVVVLAATLAIAGCVQPPPQVIPTAQPSSKPVFKTDAAALAAAKKAYLAYDAISDAVAQDGGTDPARFAAVVTKSWLPNELASAHKLASTGRKQEGATRVEGLRLEQRSEDGRIAKVSVYACLDFSAVRYVDSKTGLHPSQSPLSPVPVEVDFASDEAAPRTLLVERITPWQGTDFCLQ